MQCLDSAETALKAVQQASTDHDAAVALAKLRSYTYEAYRLIDTDIERFKARQQRLRALNDETIRLVRARASDEVDIDRLKRSAGDLETPERQRIAGLFDEFGIDATEEDAEDVMGEEYELRMEAALNNVVLEKRAGQLDAALKRLREFLDTKWPAVRTRIDTMLTTTRNLEQIYNEVNEEVERAHVVNVSEIQETARAQPREPRRRGNRRGRKREHDDERQDDRPNKRQDTRTRDESVTRSDGRDAQDSRSDGRPRRDERRGERRDERRDTRSDDRRDDRRDNRHDGRNDRRNEAHSDSRNDARRDDRRRRRR